MAEKTVPTFSPALFEQVLDKIHHPVTVMDTKGVIVYCNPAMLAYVGKVTGRSWNKEEIYRLNIEALHPPKSFPGMREQFNKVLLGEPLKPRFNRVGDTMFMTYDSCLKDQDGKVVGVMMEKIPVNIMYEELPQKK